ncbi:hypothetical protein B9Z19DRAFT_1071910, partial [Tuber borchii]
MKPHLPSLTKTHHPLKQTPHSGCTAPPAAKLLPVFRRPKPPSENIFLSIHPQSLRPSAQTTRRHWYS